MTTIGGGAGSVDAGADAAAMASAPIDAPPISATNMLVS
jgi:hypothetical protein